MVIRWIALSKLLTAEARAISSHPFSRNCSNNSQDTNVAFRVNLSHIKLPSVVLKSREPNSQTLMVITFGLLTKLESWQNTGRTGSSPLACSPIIVCKLPARLSVAKIRDYSLYLAKSLLSCSRNFCHNF